MKNLISYVFFLLLFAFLFAPAQFIAAQERVAAPPLRSDFSYGVGFQSTFPAFGVSGMYDFNAHMTGQAILGFFGGLQMYSGRLLYRFNQQEAYNLFGFGTVGMWRYSTPGFGQIDGASVSALGLGGGAGIELNWAQIFDSPTFPPLFSSIEIGFVHLVADDNVPNFSSLAFGAGLHYRFGGSSVPEGQIPPEGPIVAEEIAERAVEEEREPEQENVISADAGDQTADAQSGTSAMNFARMQQYKDPGTATLISVFITGGGHIYAGETGKGLVLLGLGYLSVPVGAGISYALLQDCTYAGCETAYIPILAGGVVALGTYIYSLIDAGDAARRSNARSGLTDARINVRPAFGIHEGVASYGLQASVSL